MRPNRWCALLTIPLILGSGSAARAMDHSNLEEGLPTEVEDAYPIPAGGRELQGLGRWTRTHQDKERFRLEARLEVGLFRNFQAKVLAPVLFGSAGNEGSGDLGIEAFYNTNQEGRVLPAFALSAKALLPTGVDSIGTQYGVKLLLTKTLPGGYLFHRIHINVAGWYDSVRFPEQRAWRYIAVVGYSIRAGADTLLVANYVREQERVRGESANLLELGVRRMVTPLLVLVLGGGLGILEESPAFRATVGFQYALPF